MKIKILLTLFLLSLSVDAQRRSEREKDELFGPVKSVLITEANQTARNQERPESESVIDQFAAYDTNGNKIEQAQYDNDGKFLWKWTTKYDTSQKEIEMIVFEKDLSIRDRIVTKYDSRQRKRIAIDYDGKGKVRSRTTYRYFDQGRMTETIFNAQGKRSVVWRKKFDLAGNVVEEGQTLYDVATSDGANKWKYVFDSKGNWIEW